AEERDTGDRLLTALGADDGPVLARRAVAGDEGLAEPDLGRSLLVGECPAGVLGHAVGAFVRVAKRGRPEEGVVGVDAPDGFDVLFGPCAQPGLAPAPGGILAHPPAATYAAPCSLSTAWAAASRASG